MFRFSLFLFLLVWTLAPTHGQETSRTFAQTLEKYRIQPIVGVQLWTTYTHNAEIFNAEADAYRPVSDRLNVQLHRSRLGVKGQPYAQLKFNITGAFDFVGQDALAGTEGGLNNGGSPIFRLWNAHVSWQVNANSQALFVTVGYQPPPIGRESLAPALRVPSMEKAWTQNYLRRHLVGTAPGRALGINLGGAVEVGEKLNVKYDGGVFTPTFTAFGGNSSGVSAAPLFVGRAVFQFGQPERPGYYLGHRVHYDGQRRGLSVAVAGARADRTDRWLENSAFGVDVLLNLGPFHLSGEWHRLERVPIFSNPVPSATAQTGFLRAGYLMARANGTKLEPVVTYVFLEGADNDTDLRVAQAASIFAGTDRTLEFNLNYYLNANLKLNFAYTVRDGDTGTISDLGLPLNNFYAAPAVGAIRRGDWAGLGLVAVF